MIRDRGPILLIPAAWMLTFATIIYPGVDPYWIRHMHYFMVLFLTGFSLLSWQEMGDNEVLDIWRKVIAAGAVFTLLGALSFSVQSYSNILAWSSAIYWFLGPGIGLYLSAEHMDQYSDIYRKLGIESGISFIAFAAGIILSIDALTGLAIAGIAVSQTLSMVLAARLDTEGE